MNSTPKKQKIAVVTGASSGIGEALCRRLLDRGYKVLLIARRRDRLDELRALLPPDRVEVFVGDVTHESQMREAAQVAVARFGAVDMVIANAGMGISGPFESLSNEDYRKQFETNIFGVMNTVRAFLPALKKSRGSLGLLGSVASFVSPATYSPYSMSKYAVRALADSLYLELRHFGVAVTLVAPGFVESEIRRLKKDGTAFPVEEDPIPAWITMSRERAAKHILCGLEKRRREIVITLHGKLIVFVSRHFPGLMAWLLSRVSPPLRKTG